MRLIDILTPEEQEITTLLINNGPYHYTPITYSNSDKAMTLINKAVEKLRTTSWAKIYIFFDVDFDGLASGYLMWTMLRVLGQCNPLRIIPIINKERKHGITDNIVETINSDKDNILTIIVDSSTNLTNIFTKLNSDCLIIDHHDVEISSDLLNGQTTGGDYTIVNNEIDHIEYKSATEVVYEFWYNYSPDVLRDLQLEEWVAISLYSDVIHTYTSQNLWFTSFLRDLRPNCDIKKIVEPLNLVEVHNGKACLTRNSISFQLVPLVNSCMRLQCGQELIDIILYRPHILPSYKSCVMKQKQIVEILYKNAKIENYNDVMLVKLVKRISTKSGNILEQMNAQKQNSILSSVDISVLDGFNGLLATKVSNKNDTVALVYDIYNEDDKQIVKGSIRTQGRYKNINLRALLMNKPGWTASGHSDAFGFTYDLSFGDVHNMASDVVETLADSKQSQNHQTRFHLADYNFFYNLTNTTNVDTINEVHRIAELNNLKTLNDRYYFEFQVGAGFVIPQKNRYSSSIVDYVFSGHGLLRFKLTNYDGEEPTFEMGKKYEVYLEGTDGNTVHGTISEVTSKSNA